ncbi:MAG: TetR/AcrR family transcriptional regulator [Ignavibacteriaceae bacterium]
MTEHLINNNLIMPRSKEQFREMREKTRKVILENALKLFSIKGYHGTSINDIAKAAGISKGLAYNYFESKQKLVEALFEQMLQIGQEFEEILDSSLEPYKKLEVLIEFSFKYIEENEEFWRLYISFVLQPEIIEQGKKVSNEFNSGILKKFEKILKQAGLKSPAIEARILGALFDGIGLDYFIDKSNFPLQKIKKLVLKRYSKEGIEKLKEI